MPRSEIPEVPGILRDITYYRTQRNAAEAKTGDAVRRARKRGVSWTRIGDALGIRHQNARKTYLKYDDGR